MRARPDLPETILNRVAAEILASQSGSTGEAAGKAIRDEIATRLRIEPAVKQAMAEAFAVVLEEFRHTTLNDSRVLETVGRQVHGVTGGQMREFAQRLRAAIPRPLTEEQILSWADEHQDRTGEWPTAWSGPVQGEQDETWIAIHGALSRGLRELPGGSSLAQLLDKHRGKRNPKDLPPLTEEQVLAWADAHHERTGQWPNSDSGSVHDCRSDTWSAIDYSLRKGARGFPGGSSLTQFLHSQRGRRNKNKLPELVSEQILAWADAHFERMGEWPSTESGELVDAPGETWKAIGMALVTGGRGLPGGRLVGQTACRTPR